VPTGRPFTVALVAVLVLVAAAEVPAQFASESDRREALKHYRSGQELLHAEAWERAAAEFTQAVKLDPLLALAHYGLGQANMGLKNYPGAIRAYTGCVEAYRTLHSLSHSNKATIERLRNDEIRELRDSLSTLQSGKVKAGNDPLTITRLENRIRDLERERHRAMKGEAFEPPAAVSMALGSAHFRQGNLADAEKFYLAAVSADPKFGEARNNLAVVYFMTGRYDLARQQVKEAEKAGFKVHPALKRDIETRAHGGF
jgi:tetratricopeptide (TPR) repeat protein